MPRTIYLVSCVSMKSNAAVEARDLYVSPWFLKARAFVESTEAPWFVLSARYGLLSPYRVVGPYEQTLNAMSQAARIAWATDVLQDLRATVQPGDTVVFLAGQHYRNHLAPWLTELGVRVEVPMRGLAIGQQLAWLSGTANRPTQPGGRLDAMRKLYDLLDDLERRTGGTRVLAHCNGGKHWPKRGVYFFFEEGECRSTSGEGRRVVRVGTHAVSKGSRSTLWQRLAQHKGTQSGGGNHRGSIFRRWVGESLLQRHGLTCETWSAGSSAPRAVCEGEDWLERRVSEAIGVMPFLCLDIDDEPGKDSDRARVERGAIALLSNATSTSPVDPAAARWLGQACPKSEIRASGLWNVNHVTENCDLGFLDVMARHVDKTRDA